MEEWIYAAGIKGSGNQRKGGLEKTKGNGDEMKRKSKHGPTESQGKRVSRERGLKTGGIETRGNQGNGDQGKRESRGGEIKGNGIDRKENYLKGNHREGRSREKEVILKGSRESREGV